MIDPLRMVTDFSQRSIIALDCAFETAGSHPKQIGMLHIIDQDVSMDFMRDDQDRMPPVLVQLLDARLPAGAKRRSALAFLLMPTSQWSTRYGPRPPDDEPPRNVFGQHGE